MTTLTTRQHENDPNFPPRVLEAANRYKYEETLKNDPVEYQRIYEELKVEAALVVIVSAPHRNLTNPV